MTFKEKLAQEHPEELNPYAHGGCNGCPKTYGYEKEGCGECGSSSKCTECWNREVPNTPAPMTAEEAWEIAQRFAYGDLQSSTLRKEIFGDSGLYACMKQPIQEVKATLDEWERKQIRVGDVLTHKYDESFVVVTKIKDNEMIDVIRNDGAVGGVYIKNCKKIGKHIDIQSVLDQIGGGKHD